MAGKTRNLQFKDGRYYARLSVHKELRPVLGKGELVVALGADRRAALNALPAAVVAMKAEIERAKGKVAPPKPDYRPALSPRRQMAPVEIAHDHLTQQLAFDTAIRDTASPAIGLAYPDEQYIADLRELAGGRLVHPLPGPVAVALDRARERGNLTNQAATIRMLARAELLVLDTGMHRDEGEADPPIPADLIPAPRAAAPEQSARILCEDSTKTLSELLPRYLRERKPTPATAHEYAVIVRQFEELMDPVPAVHAIARRHIQRFRDRLQEAPASYVKRFPNMTMPEAIEANAKRPKPYPLLNPKTINDKMLAGLRAMLNWAVRQDIIPDNPGAGVLVEIPRSDEEEDGRDYFHPSDLTALFDRKLFMPKGVIDEDRWAYLVALFAGLRPSESAQMRLDSIRHQRGILCFVVEEQTKNKGSRRIVPVHSTLIELGLERRIEALRTAGKEHLFPIWYRDGMEAKAEAAAKGKQVLNHFFPRFVPRRFNYTYRKNAGITDPKKVFYSFRHTFKTGLSLAGVSKDIRDELCGHTEQSASEVYVHQQSVEVLKDAVEKLHYDGFKSENLIKLSF